MKFLGILIASFLYVVVASTSLAQPVESETVFPHAGLNFWFPDNNSTNRTMIDNLMDEAGLNMLYNCGSDFYGPIAGKTGYPLYEVLNNFIGRKDNPLHSTEMRFFLTSEVSGSKGSNGKPIPSFQGLTGDDGKFAYDVVRNWTNKTGSLQSTTNEWFIASTVTNSNLLSNLQVNQGDLSASSEDNNASYIVDNNSVNIHFDFIFRLDLNDPLYTAITNNSQTLYQIEYSFKEQPLGGGSIATVVKQTENITKATYQNLFNTTLHPERVKELSNIRTFAGKSYAILRTSIGLTPQSGNKIVSVECKLLRNSAGSQGIFVRGLRIRSDSCDMLLKGQLDGGLNTIFNQIKTDLTLNGAWDKTSAIAPSGEFYWPSFRAFAYMEKKWRTFSGGKRIIPILATNLHADTYHRFRAICEDQSGSVPSFVPQCISSTLIYDDMQATHPTGYPLDLFPQARLDFQYPSSPNASDFSTFGFPIQDYTDYTINWQERFRQCSKETESKVSVGPTGAAPLKWLGGLWTHMEFRYPNNVSDGKVELSEGIDDSRFRRQKDQLDVTYPGESVSFRQAYINDIKNGICWPNYEKVYDIRHVMNVDGANDNGTVGTPLSGTVDTDPDDGIPDKYSGTTFNIGKPTFLDPSTKDITYVEDKSSQFRMDSRSLTWPELRADAWQAICFGAKGIIWNTIASDGSENIGIVSPEWQHDYDWWDDGAGLPSGGKRALITTIRLGSENFPFLPIESFEKFRIQKQERISGVYTNVENCNPSNGVITNWMDKGTSSWDGYSNMATDMASFYSAVNSHASNAITLLQGIVDEYAKEVLCSPTEKASYGGTTNGNVRWIVTLPGGDPQLRASYKPSGSAVCATCEWDAGFGNSAQWPYTKTPEFSVWAPTLYGFKERFRGVKAFADDIRPLARTVSELTWKASFFLEDVTATSSTLCSSFEEIVPIECASIVSNKAALVSGSAPSLNNFSGVDNDGETFYQLGVFHHSSESEIVKVGSDDKVRGAIYVSILNKRTWPFYFNDPEHPDRDDIQVEDNSTTAGKAMLGAIDNRRLDFKVNPDVFLNGNSFNFFSVTNLKTGDEKIISTAENFELQLEPGEGTLVRISPAYGFPVGKTSEDGMAFNNGHRIAEIIETEEQTPSKKIMVWERKGQIQFAVINNPPMEDEENALTQEISSVISLSHVDDGENVLNTSGFDPDFGMNPSVASRNGKVAVVWNSTLSNGDRKVYIAEGSPNSGDWSSITWKKGQLTSSAIGTLTDDFHDGHLVTPSITPTSDAWFCSWAEPRGIRVCVAKFVGPTLNKFFLSPNNLINAEGPIDLNSDQDFDEPGEDTYTGFPTVASRNESHLGENFQRLHLAWEERKNTMGISHIYYQSFHYTPSTTTLAFDNGMEKVSRFAISCEHHHPNIAVANQCDYDAEWEPVVAWEMKVQGSDCINGEPVYNDDVSVVYRERYSSGGWSSFTSMFPKKGNLPLPLVTSPNADNICQIRDLSSGPDDPGVIYEGSYSLVFQDSFAQVVRIERLMHKAYKENGVHKSKTYFDHKRLVELGRTPSLFMPYTEKTKEHVSTFTYRGTNRSRSEDADEDNLFSARITARTFDDVEKIPTKPTIVQTLAAIDDQWCDKLMRISFGPPEVKCDTCDTTTVVEWSINDITHQNTSYFSQASASGANPWLRVEDSVKTDYFSVNSGDTLYLDRILHISDTAWLKDLLDDSTKSIEVQLVLKDSASKQTISTIDNILLTGSNIEEAVSFSDPCGQSTPSEPPPPPAWSGFPFPERKIVFAIDSLPPSGTAYLTISMVKADSVTALLGQTIELRDQFKAKTYVADSAAFKRSQPLSPTKLTTLQQVKVDIFPNPFNTSSTIELHTLMDAPLSVVVYDLLGKERLALYNAVASSDHYRFNLSSSELSPGSYFVRVANGNQIVTRKVELIK